MPPATPAAQATTSTPNRSSRLRTPWVAPLMANTKVAPRSSASSSMTGRLHRLRRRSEMAEWAHGKAQLPRAAGFPVHHWPQASARVGAGRPDPPGGPAVGRRAGDALHPGMGPDGGALHHPDPVDDPPLDGRGLPQLR